MADEHPLTLRQADQARTDFAAIESDLDHEPTRPSSNAEAVGGATLRWSWSVRRFSCRPWHSCFGSAASCRGARGGLCGRSKPSRDKNAGASSAVCEHAAQSTFTKSPSPRFSMRADIEGHRLPVVPRERERSKLVTGALGQLVRGRPFRKCSVGAATPNQGMHHLPPRR
jgi:hypothetical protein